MASNRITLVLEPSGQQGGNILLADFAHSVEALRSSLANTENTVAHGNAGIEWRVVDLRHSSPASVVVEPMKTSATHEPDYCEQIVERVFRNWHSLVFGNEVPNDMPHAELKAYAGLSERIRQGRIRATLSNGAHTAIEITRESGALLQRVMNETRTSLGSVVGRLERVNIHGNRNEATIWPEIGAEKVECYIPDHLVADTGKALGRRVRLSGVLTYPARSPFAGYVKVAQIEVLPNDEELPTLMDIRGIMPTLTGGLSAEDFLRSLRSNDG